MAVSGLVRWQCWWCWVCLSCPSQPYGLHFAGAPAGFLPGLFFCRLQLHLSLLAIILLQLLALCDGDALVDLCLFFLSCRYRCSPRNLDVRGDSAFHDDHPPPPVTNYRTDSAHLSWTIICACKAKQSKSIPAWPRRTGFTHLSPIQGVGYNYGMRSILIRFSNLTSRIHAVFSSFINA